MTAPTPRKQGVGSFSQHAVHLVRNGYRVIPIPGGSKGPNLSDWRNKAPRTPADAAAMAERHRSDGVGILTTDTPAVDLDILDANIVARMSEFVRDNLGDGLLRIGKAPKALFLFATDTPFPKVTSASFIDPANPTRADGKPLKQRVEILGEGQQFCALHIHPETGRPYVWPEPGEDPLDVPALDLPVITAEHARAVCAFFEKLATEAGWSPAGSGNDGDGAAVVDALAQAAPPDESDAEVARVRAALAHVSPDCSREDYLAVLAGLRWTQWLVAEELALEWAAGSAEGKFNERDFNRDWKSLKGERIGGRTITLGSVIRLAQEGGFDAARVVDPVVADATFEELLARAEDLDGNDDRKYQKELIADVAKASLDAFDRSRLIKVIAKGMDTSPRDVKAMLSEAKNGRREHGEPTHANYAQALLHNIEVSTGSSARGVEGQVWSYDSGEGVWVGKQPARLSVEVANEFDGMEGCKRRADYVAIATHAYEVAARGNEDFFNDAPIGMACAGRFYAIEGGEIKRQPIAQHHRQRVLINVAPKVMDTPVWDRLMAATFDGDKDREQELLLEEYIGSMLLGFGHKFEKVLLMKGVGRAGKGTILKIVSAILPAEFQCAVPPDKWTEQYYLATLAGRRLNVVGELSDETPVDGAAFKQLVGRDLVQARAPGQMPFSFTNSATHIFNSNYFVPTRDHSEAFYTRWILMEFRNSMIGKAIDVDLADRVIADELPGVVARFLKGAQRLLERGEFATTAAHNRLMDQWRKRSSSLVEFITDGDFCRLGEFPSVTLSRSVFYAAYVDWCRASSRKPLSKQKMYDEFEASHAVGALGVRFAKRSTGNVLVRGLVLRDQVFGNVEDDDDL